MKKKWDDNRPVGMTPGLCLVHTYTYTCIQTCIYIHTYKTLLTRHISKSIEFSSEEKMGWQQAGRDDTRVMPRTHIHIYMHTDMHIHTYIQNFTDASYIQKHRIFKWRKNGMTTGRSGWHQGYASYTHTHIHAYRHAYTYIHTKLYWRVIYPKA